MVVSCLRHPAYDASLHDTSLWCLHDHRPANTAGMTYSHERGFQASTGAARLCGTCCDSWQAEEGQELSIHSDSLVCNWVPFCVNGTLCQFGVSHGSHLVPAPSCSPSPSLTPRAWSLTHLQVFQGQAAQMLRPPGCALLQDAAPTHRGCLEAHALNFLYAALNVHCAVAWVSQWTALWTLQPSPKCSAESHTVRPLDLLPSSRAP
jgi:hypothetical protein